MKAKMFILAIVLCGCMSDKQPTTRSSVGDRQQQALNDPFGYSPDMGSPDISGGKINEYDGKAMKKDLDHVLNP
jgi:hypothetical protein